MTFILGMKCSDGIVICSDRMEADGFSVRQRPKIETVNVGNEWGVCWGGSGAANPVDKFSDMLRQSLGNDSFNKTSIERKADGCLKLIKQNYAGEFIKIVLGVFGMPLMKPRSGPPYPGHLERVLYRGDSDSCCLSPEREWCCAGIDDTLTKFLMESTFHRAMNVLEGEQLGIWVSGMMKKFAAGVGGPTDVVFFVPGLPAWCSMTESNVTKLEKRFPNADAGTYMGQYWADWHPRTWSAKRMKTPMQKLRSRLKRSVYRTCAPEP